VVADEEGVRGSVLLVIDHATDELVGWKATKCCDR
jgi:hypothetical protein